MVDDSEKKRVKVTSVVSRRLSGGGLLELIYQTDMRKTAFAVFRGSEVTIESSVEADNGERLVPVPATNNLIRHGALLFADRPEPFGSVGELIEATQS